MKVTIKGMAAAIFDMDGVITQTAILHEKAWKQLFDDFLKTKNKDFKPFSHDDYLSFVDGIPRYEGVSEFLKLRGMELPRGEPSDSPEEETVCGLGNRKNVLFLNILEKEGVKVYDDTISRIKKWKQAGIKTAVISSSKNCRMILEKAGVLQLFDVRVDGTVSEELNLKGKPAPDIFLEAAKRMNVDPARTAVFEDAESGVLAGSKGAFRFVFGIKRKGDKKELLLHGAHWALRNLYEVDMENGEGEIFFEQHLPSALDEEESIFEKMKGSRPALFFDYDGTLLPIVSQPEDAVLTEAMRETLRQTAQLFPVAVVSGRDLNDIRARVGLENLVYAGSHRFHNQGPGGLHLEKEEAQLALPALDELEKLLKMELKPQIKGSRIDRKKYAIAVHYRNVEKRDVVKIREYLGVKVGGYQNLKLTKGKCIFEIKPAIDWDKGKAVRWLLDRLELQNKKNFPVYFGDDVTDEDAFVELVDDGAGVIVGEIDRPTAASFSLKDEKELEHFLRFMTGREPSGRATKKSDSAGTSKIK